jgi:hypothetical protein
MGPWEVRVREYLDFRRRLGFALRTAGDELVLPGSERDATIHYTWFREATSSDSR